MNKPDIHDCVIDIEDTRDLHHRKFAGKRKQRGNDPHFSELELVILEKLFAAPARMPLTSDGLTAKELTALIGRKVNTIRPRLRNLERKGAIRDSGLFVRVNSRKEILWRAIT